MEWKEISVRVPKQETDLVSVIFTDLGAGGIVIDDEDAGATGEVVLTSYLADDAELPEKLAGLSAQLAALAERDGFPLETPCYSQRSVRDEDWDENWKAYYHTQRVGKRLVIQPTWESYTPAPGDLVLRLDPESAFGTGTHPTTAMCLRALEALVTPQRHQRVFDVGTGSGVLAIAAAKLGAASVVAKDYSRTAAEVAARNAAQNGVQDLVETGVSDLLAAFEGKADLIVANIIADIIIRLFDELEPHLAPGGQLLASGIIDERLEDVERAAAAHGLAIRRRLEQDGWEALLICRQQDREGEA